MLCVPCVMEENDGWALPGSVWMDGDSLAPPCGSEPSVVERIVALAALGPDDVVVDLGCGFGTSRVDQPQGTYPSCSSRNFWTSLRLSQLVKTSRFGSLWLVSGSLAADADDWAQNVSRPDLS